MDKVKHPAKYSKPIMEVIEQMVLELTASLGVREDWYLLDPMGGVGGVFELHNCESTYEVPHESPEGEEVIQHVHERFHITSVEIEKEWADQGYDHPLFDIELDTIRAMNFFEFAAHYLNQGRFDLAVTSWTYGNRMADHHTPSPEDTSVRNTYRHKLGRPLTEGSSAMLQWGEEYRRFHQDAYAAVWMCLEAGGYFIVNVKDHIRKGKKQPVCAWHKAAAKKIGFVLVKEEAVPVTGNRQGQNGDVRVDHEMVYLFSKPYNITTDKKGNRAEYAQPVLK